MSEVSAFSVSFACLNCGLEWDEQFVKGDRVRNSYPSPWVEDANCTHDHNCAVCRAIQCSSCEVGEVLVKDRRPS